jgi:hypothetical protein
MDSIETDTLRTEISPYALVWSEIEDDALLTPEQAAAFLNVTPHTLASWRVKGGGPEFVRLSHKIVRYAMGRLRAHIVARTATSTSAEAAA